MNSIETIYSAITASDESAERVIREAIKFNPAAQTTADACRKVSGTIQGVASATIRAACQGADRDATQRNIDTLALVVEFVKA